MNWLKRIFCNQEEFNAHVDINELPPVDNILPIPVMKPCKPEKDISEPVLSFVECVQENPKRFVVREDFKYFGLKFSNNLDIRSTKPEMYVFCLEDKVTKEMWTLSEGVELNFYNGFKENKHTYNPEWLTDDEKEYLITSIKPIFHNRRDRKEKLQELRKQRRIRDERNRLKEIYK